MKVIKDAMMKWLDAEIEKIVPAVNYGDDMRRDTLIEVRTKLTEVITEEFHKLSESKDA